MYEKQVVQKISDLGLPYSIHICGDASSIVADMGSTGAQILEIDRKTDMGLARSVVPDNVILMGNIDRSDPMCIGIPEKVKSQIKEMIEKTRGRGIIISSGCRRGKALRIRQWSWLFQAATISQLFFAAIHLFHLRSMSIGFPPARTNPPAGRFPAIVEDKPAAVYGVPRSRKRINQRSVPYVQ